MGGHVHGVLRQRDLFLGQVHVFRATFGDAVICSDLHGIVGAPIMLFIALHRHGLRFPLITPDRSRHRFNRLILLHT